MSRIVAVACVAASAVLAVGGPVRAVPSDYGTVDRPLDAGAVTVVHLDDRTAPIERGAGSTVFTLALPDDARCPGDSANDQYRVHGFIVPATVDPAALEFGPNDPDGEGNWSLYDTNTNPYIHRLLDPNPIAGQPARIPAVGPLSFAVFPPGYLGTGEYTIGLACSYFADTTTYWDTNIVITTDTSDEPGQIVWRLASAAPSEGGSDSWPARWSFVAIAVAIGAAGVLLLRRRWRLETPSPLAGPLASRVPVQTSTNKESS